jgi:hypothetical protein
MAILEIIALVFLCKKNGYLAAQKGLRATAWKWYTVLAWIAGELTGVLFGLGLYRQEDSIKDNFIAISALGLVCAFGGYLFIRSLLEKKPDVFDEDIKQVGTDDLQPPRNR